MPILCRVTRGDFTESIHVVFAVAVDENGEIFFSAGDPHYLTCIRSALKPFQAAAAIKGGAVDAAGFSDNHIALMCASHKGEKEHVNTARHMLEKLDLTINDYECGTHYPSDKMTRWGMIKDGQMALALHNNCSGKHTGMLALAKHLNQGIKNYTQKDHPVQETIFALLQEYTGLETIPTSIDGCSAPTPFITLSAIAGLFQKLGSGEHPELERAYQAMVKHPFLVSGSDTFDTLFIEALQGRGVTKIGGESIRGVSIKKADGGCVGLALKVLDGNFRALSPATMKLLEHLQLLNKKELSRLERFSAGILKNHNQIEIGRIEATLDE